MDNRVEIEKKKGYLREYQEIKRQLERTEEELEELRLNKMYPSAVQDGMPHGSGCSDLSEYYSKVDELERKIEKYMCEKTQKLWEIRSRIEQLENENEKDVLIYRYINGMKWEAVAAKMGYSWRRIHYIHSSALKNFKISKSA